MKSHENSQILKSNICLETVETAKQLLGESVDKTTIWIVNTKNCLERKSMKNVKSHKNSKILIWNIGLHLQIYVESKHDHCGNGIPYLGVE